MIKIWVDDLRPAPAGYEHFRSVEETVSFLSKNSKKVELLDLDHDAGNYSYLGGDFIRILDWLEKEGISLPIRIHTANPVGRRNMERIVKKNNWRLVK